MINITYIYLVENCYGDPNKVYIGKTKGNWRESFHKKTYGKQIIYTCIDQINSLKREDWEPLETFWIQQFKVWGFDVVNKRKKGGGGPEFWTTEMKQKHKMLRPGSGPKSCSEETKLKISKNNSKPKPENFGEIISKIQKGKSKPKTSLANKGKKKPKRSEEHIKNLSKPRLNKDKLKNNKPPLINITCPHCNKSGLLGPMKRWHFNNCTISIKID